MAITSFLPCDKRTKWPPWTKRPITHQHRVNVTKVPSRLTDKDSQPPVYQVGLGQRVYIIPEALWATLGHLPPIPQHPRTPGHKAFRSKLTANELGGIRFAGVGPKWSTIQPRSARANPSDNQGLWGSGVSIFLQRSHTYRGRRMPMGVTSNWCQPQGHHARRPPTTVPKRSQEKTFQYHRSKEKVTISPNGPDIWMAVNFYSIKMKQKWNVWYNIAMLLCYWNFAFTFGFKELTPHLAAI